MSVALRAAVLAAVAFLVLMGTVLPCQAADKPAEAAAKVDRMLGEEALRGKALAPPIDDATYLRRISLDIVGDVPTPTEIAAFVLDPSADKRSHMVEWMLAQPNFGQNWGRYWRDVFLARAGDERTRARVGNTATVYLTEQFNKGTGWDQITREMITATGVTNRDGKTAVIVAQEGKAEQTAAEVARVFLGFQIQCAQCHDHPYDPWKREQFHQFAAFFPRVVVRGVPGAIDELEVTSLDVVRVGNRSSAKPEHFMPDKQDPKAKGTQMQPVFFLNGRSLDPGQSDEVRRRTLADWITARDNPWFAKAFVNRIWSELLGRGFYEPIDDLGEDRKCAAPRTVDYLSQQFAENGYDLRWLLRTITATSAYQRQSRSRSAANDAPFAAVVVQPLRSDVLFSALTAALGAYDMEHVVIDRFGRPEGPRSEFDQLFGFDPSLPRDEVSESIPQALALMNSSQLSRRLRSDSAKSALGKLLASESHDDLVTTELYLRALSREPSARELAAVVAFVQKGGSRAEGFEDVLWALVNSAEFRERR